jgi:hypothetical protein
VISALALAVVAAIQPLGLIAFMGVLGSRGGRRNARGFILGWVACAGAVALVTFLLAGGDDPGRAVAVIGSAGFAQIGLGLIALLYLVVRRRRDPTPVERSDDASTKADGLGPIGAAWIGALLQGWPVVAAAVAAVLKSTDGAIGRLLGVAAVIAVSVSTYVAIYVMAGRDPERTGAWLEARRRWFDAHRRRVIDILLLGAGSYLVIHGSLVQIMK